MTPEERKIDEILDSVYAAGAYVTEQRTNNNSTGTITSDRMFEAKASLLQMLADARKEERQSIVAAVIAIAEGITHEEARTQLNPKEKES